MRIEVFELSSPAVSFETSVPADSAIVGAPSIFCFLKDTTSVASAAIRSSGTVASDGFVADPTIPASLTLFFGGRPRLRLIGFPFSSYWTGGGGFFSANTVSACFTPLSLRLFCFITTKSSSSSSSESSSPYILVVQGHKS